MSGGSFNYAYRAILLAEVDIFAENRWSVERIAEELLKLGYDDAAGELFDLLGWLKSVEARLQSAERRGLHDVMKALEWWRSADWGADQLSAAIEKYRTPGAREDVNE